MSHTVEHATKAGEENKATGSVLQGLSVATLTVAATNSPLYDTCSMSAYYVVFIGTDISRITIVKLCKVNPQRQYTLKEKRKGLFHTQLHLPPKEVGELSGV